MDEAKVLEEMKRLKGTQTEKNLRAAYAGESQAHVKYNLFANEAEKDPECSRQIADLFRETANNERAHAKIWFWLVGDLKKTTMNGPPCIRDLLKPLKKKVSPRLPSSSPKSVKSKNPMKPATNCSLPT